MLDKSIPYFNIIMLRRAGTPLPSVNLPKGFRFEYYGPGDAIHWAEIEYSVLEFDTEPEALSNFRSHYMTYSDQLFRRCLFLVSDSGEKIGTATAWWSSVEDERVPAIHWVAVKPGFQNRGLGRALINRVVRESVKIDGDRDSYLHTQTWSYKAIKLYLQAGYGILKRGTFAHFSNDYRDALPLLKERMGNSFLEERDTIDL